jgi:hypothetical protein
MLLLPLMLHMKRFYKANKSVVLVDLCVCSDVVG